MDAPILGADTETFNGYVKLLALSDGRYVEPRWDGTTPSAYTDELLDFLYEAAGKARWVVWWNLGFDFAAIVKPWVVDHADQLRETHYKNVERRKRLKELTLEMETEGLSPEEAREVQELTTLLDGEDNIERFDTDRYHVTLIGGKGFSLSKLGGEEHRRGRGRRWFFDAAAWYSTSFGGVSLDYAAKKYLGEGKTNEDLGISRERLGSEAGYYEAHREDILRYCVQDCSLTARLMDRTVRAFESLGYPFPDKPFSRASVSREYLKVSHVLDPTAMSYQRLRLNTFKNLWELAFQGGVFLLMGAGEWTNPWSLDINSAYPDAMVHFPSLEEAEIVERTDPRFEGCYFKFYRIRLDPTPRTPTRDIGETRKIYAWTYEEVSVCVTGIDLEVLEEMGEPYVIEEACGVYTPYPNERPLEYLGEAFARKSEVKKRFGADSVEYSNLKIFLNGTYGLLAQRRPRESQWTNLIYASYVTAWCRRALWRAVRKVEEAGDYVVSLATDGLLAVGENSRDYWREQDSPKLGAWSYTPHDRAVTFESGVGFLWDDGKADPHEVKKRGMPHLTVEALMGCADPSWSEKSSRPVKLRSALIQRPKESDAIKVGMTRIGMLGVFEEHERTLTPVQSYADAGMAFPKELVHLPLKHYFHHGFKLRLRGQVGDRLTPPCDPLARVRWDSTLHRSRHERGYLYPPRLSNLATRKSGESRGEAHGGEGPPPAGETALVPSVGGSERRKASRRVRPSLPSSPENQTETVS